MTERANLESIASDINEVKIVLKGYNGHLGLIPAFEEHLREEREFKKEFYFFRRTCFLIFGLALGSGTGVGVGISQLVTRLL